MAYTLGQAATAAGLDQLTILRSIAAGRISAVRDHFGNWAIDPAELHRLHPPVSAQSSEEQDATGSTAALDAQIQALRDVSDLMHAQLGEMRIKLDYVRDRLTEARAIEKQLCGMRASN